MRVELIEHRSHPRKYLFSQLRRLFGIRPGQLAELVQEAVEADDCAALVAVAVAGGFLGIIHNALAASFAVACSIATSSDPGPTAPRVRSFPASGSRRSAAP